MAIRSFVSRLTPMALVMAAWATFASAAAIAAEPSPSVSEAPADRTIDATCDLSPPCVLSAGTWTLDGEFTFIQGMQVTVPDGWQSLESDAGEFNLFPLAHPNDHIFMVKDIVAMTTDGTVQLVPDVPPTIDGLWTYWDDDPNLVVSEPTSTTIAGGLDAVTFTVGVSPDAQFTDPGCPVYPRCADMFTDPRYWGGPYGVGAPAVVRFYMATAMNGDKPYLFVVGLEGEDEAALERLTADATPIIESIRLPQEFPVW
jgi:hypothetical protein